MNAEPFHDRVALVTGAGRGIGREIALGLADAGARVALVARTAAQVHDVAREIGERGTTTLALQFDVSDAGATEQALARVASELGPVEILINNAAVVWPLGPSASSTPPSGRRPLRSTSSLRCDSDSRYCQG